MPSTRSANTIGEVAAPAVEIIRATDADISLASEFQLAIFHWFRTGDIGDDSYQHLIVRARAGTGKTWTLLRALMEAPERRILLLAFMRRIMEEMKSKLADMGGEADVRTAHSLGYRAIIRQLGRISLLEGKQRFAREDMVSDAISKGLPFGSKRLIAKMFTKARELYPVKHTLANLVEMAYNHDLTPEPDSSLTVEQLARATANALEYGLQPHTFKNGIDHADQIFLPLALNLLHPEYDMVIGDEAQDFNEPQLDIMRRSVFPYGRIVLVGDDRQGIFAFRGADTTGLDRLKKELGAAELPLSRTYRCPQSVVTLAKQYVPDYEADPSNPEGIISHVADSDELIKAVGPGDFVLSRRNAPLAKLALHTLRAGKPAKIQGRDIGNGLKALIRQLAKGDAAHSIPKFLARLDNYADKMRTRLQAAGHEEHIEALNDKVETLKWLAEDATGVPGLTDRIENLFTDEPGAAVIFSTVHKAKGLETNRVFILESTFGIPIPCECGHRHYAKGCARRCGCTKYTADRKKQLEEQNIKYVAITRAKRELTWADGDYR
jgi:superfamily I DNA/RNA helicase